MYVGFERVSCRGSVKTASDLHIPPNATGAIIQSEIGAVRYTCDNKTDPTGDTGMLVKLTDLPFQMLIEDVIRIRFCGDGAPDEEESSSSSSLSSPSSQSSKSSQSTSSSSQSVSESSQSTSSSSVSSQSSESSKSSTSSSSSSGVTAVLNLHYFGTRDNFAGDPGNKDTPIVIPGLTPDTFQQTP
jgi:hypothetical protein